MIKGRLIVCVASCWDYDPTSKHHLMRILSGHNEILWVNYHGSRRPEATRTDLIDTWGALKRVGKGLERVSDTMTQFTPLVIPGAANPCLALAHRRMLLAQIRRAVRAVRRCPEQPIHQVQISGDAVFPADSEGVPDSRFTGKLKHSRICVTLVLSSPEMPGYAQRRTD